MADYQLSDARAILGQIWNDVVFDGEIETIRKKGSRGGAIMIGDTELGEILEPFSFHAELNEADGEVSIWLPELGVHGVGDTLIEATEDLLNTVRDYVELYLTDVSFRRASNRAPQLRHVLRAHVSDAAGSLADVLLSNQVGRAPTPLALS